MKWKLRCLSVGVLALWALLYFTLKATQNIAPEVVLVNNSAVAIARAEVQLPASLLRFPGIAVGHSAVRFYPPEQAEGDYRYAITLQGGQLLEGRCGSVRDQETGKSLIMRLDADLEVSCRVDNKL